MTTEETGRIFPMHTGDHQEINGLLPWYVTGRLDPPDRVRVETHLGICVECQAEVRFQRRLDAEIAQLPLDVDQSWREMRRQLDRETGGVGSRASEWLRGLFKPRVRSPAPWLGWAVATVAILVTAGTLLRAPQPGSPPATYRALSSGAADTAGNIVVMFRPDTRESVIREALNAIQARIVGGPTSTDGYVLKVASGQRAQALTDLRRRVSVTLAEPLDPGSPP